MRAATALLAVVGLLAGCPGREPTGTVLVLPGSAVGAEAEVLRRQISRFEVKHPAIDVEIRVTPDSADERHQLYVQWLNAGVPEPDLLQLDVIWTPEFAAAGWILPLDRFGADLGDLFPGVREATLHEGRPYALPWFVDVGMLYRRTDLVPEAPRSVGELVEAARAAQAGGGAAVDARQSPAGRAAPPVPYGLVWQGARYEGLVTVFLEHLGAFGGRILDEAGRPAVASPEAAAALAFMRDSVWESGIVPEAALGWREEPTRFAFQNGQAAFMRNWPYAYALLQAQGSEVAGKVAVSPFPAAPGGSPTAALGGAQLAINAHTRHPEAAFALLEFLTRPEQMIERARIAGQLPPRPSLYDDPALAEALAIPVGEARAVLAAARPRPTLPLWPELSQVLQRQLHRALTRQATPEQALRVAEAEMAAVLAARAPGAAPAGSGAGLLLLAVLAVAALAVALARLRRRRAGRRATGETGARMAGQTGARPPGDLGLPGDRRLAWTLVAPALAAIGLVALFPLAWTFFESLHVHDLRMPWRRRPFVGLANYAEALSRPRFWAALGHTAFFATVSVALELAFGLVLALAMDRAVRGRGLLRGAALLPWAVPTVVAAMLWRFLFDARAGLVNAALEGLGVMDSEQPVVWLARAGAAWVPVILADVWKTTPFVALLLLAGLQSIDHTLYEAARMDGAGPLGQLRHVTLPLLKPALLVALLFRVLDAFRIFDLVYVLTGGGPGTATEPIALYTWSALLQNLRFGYGSALSVIVFGVTFAVALVFVRLLGRDVLGRPGGGP